MAIGVGDRILMLQYSIYSVISPEGCASILWKSADKAADAAEAMGITSERLKELGLIDGLSRNRSAGHTAISTPWYTARDGSRVPLQPRDARLFEYASSGPGARRSPTRRQLDTAQAARCTPARILAGWRPGRT